MSPFTRRDLLKTTSTVAAGFAASRILTAAPVNRPIGLQLYSVRELLPKDFEGTLHALSAAGYSEVEAAGYYDKTAAEFRHAMDQAGLRCVSTHHPLPLWKQKEDELIEYGHTLGLDYMICSSAGGVHRNPEAKGGELNLDDWRFVADELNRIGAKVKKAGMTLGMHNHTPEFASEDGIVVYDELLRRTDPRLVVFEMDCGWVTAAGHNPVDYLSRTPERFPLLHVKDMVRTPNGYHSVVMGTGIIDYHPILRAATGLRHYFIEQEEFQGDALAELRRDAAYMRSFSL